MSQYQIFVHSVITEVIQQIMSFFKCPTTKTPWKECELKFLFKPIHDQDIMQVICWIMKNLNKREFEEFSMRIWAIWCLRLQTIHKKSEEVVYQGVLWSRIYIQEYQPSLNCVNVEDNEESVSSLDAWSAPSVGVCSLT